ncbi:MAG: polyprenol monophosphomannose synthase [Candidatus Yanofskybacteria bacterium]|nr:polyprenol monophosphomannose synthase [Candidatus Yanofskybacteria bacterium]
MTDNFAKTIVLIPTFNEKENIGPLVREIFNLYPDISVLVIDDSSLDGTAEEVLSMQSSFPNLFVIRRSGKRGLGRSYLDGFKMVADDQRYENIITMDADFSHNPKEIGPMLEKLSKGSSWIVGSRYVAGGGVENWSLRRKLLSRFANFYVGFILNTGIADMTAGFNCFKKSVLRGIDLESISSDGYAFLVELKYRAMKAGLHLSEYPITFSERREGKSKMSSGVIWESIWLPWKLRFR